jgi:DNA-binding response OmpR family regulator
MAYPAVIVVEDDVDLGGSLCAFLAGEGLDVRGVDGGAQLNQAWAERPADVLVLDINLPGESGLAIAARMRTSSRVGIIMLTARSQAHDRIAGLECGADNYLVKPVDPRELAAVIKGLARRLGSSSDEDGKPSAAWSFDPISWFLIGPNGVPVTLTTAEFCLMTTLAANPGVPVSSDDILRALGKAAAETNRRSLDSVLSRLRRKAEGKTGLPLPIKSVRSIGYVFAAPLARR